MLYLCANYDLHFILLIIHYLLYDKFMHNYQLL